MNTQRQQYGFVWIQSKGLNHLEMSDNQNVINICSIDKFPEVIGHSKISTFSK